MWKRIFKNVKMCPRSLAKMWTLQNLKISESFWEKKYFAENRGVLPLVTQLISSLIIIFVQFFFVQFIKAYTPQWIYYTHISCIDITEKPRNPNAGIVLKHTGMKTSVCYRAISAQIIIFSKSLLWTIVES